MAEGNRDGLGPAEQEGSFGQEQKGRDQDCPKRIDMLERVERDAAQPKGGVIPELPGRVCVRRLMERDRDKDRIGPGRGCVEDARKLQGDLLRRPINGGPPLGLSTPTSNRVSRAASTITLVRRGPGGIPNRTQPPGCFSRTWNSHPEHRRCPGFRCRLGPGFNQPKWAAFPCRLRISVATSGRFSSSQAIASGPFTVHANVANAGSSSGSSASRFVA